MRFVTLASMRSLKRASTHVGGINLNLNDEFFFNKTGCTALIVGIEFAKKKTYLVRFLPTMLSAMWCLAERIKQLLACCKTVRWSWKIKTRWPGNDAEGGSWEKKRPFCFWVEPWISRDLQERTGLQSQMRFAGFLVGKRRRTNMLRVVSAIHATRIGTRAIGTEGWLVQASRLHFTFLRATSTNLRILLVLVLAQEPALRI